MLRDEIARYTELSGNDGLNTPIGIIGAYLDGYEKGKADAQSEPKWIPVTERLPPKYIGEWLCCTDDGRVMALPYDTPGDGTKECVFYKWDDNGYYYEVFNVVAWMPLPNPWKGGAE